MVQQQFPGSFWNGKRVCELGAGCGVTGIVASRLGADVVLTELGQEVDLVKENIDANFPLNDQSSWEPHVQARPKGLELYWGDDASHLKPPFDYILGADIVYEVQHFDLLVKALQDVTDEKTIIVRLDEGN